MCSMQPEVGRDASVKAGESECDPHDLSVDHSAAEVCVGGEEDVLANRPALLLSRERGS